MQESRSEYERAADAYEADPEESARHMREADEAAARGAAGYLEPFIWLQDGQLIGRAACNCVLVADYMGGPSPAVELCSTHRAAVALLAALRYAQGEACGGCGDCLICTTLREVE